MRITTLILFLLVFGIGAASEPPSPSNPYSAAEKKPNATQNQNKAECDQRISQCPPATIKINTAPFIDIKTAHEPQNGNDYSSPEWASVWVSIVVALITGALAFYTARLWAATKQLVIDAADTAKLQLRPYIGFGRPNISVAHDNSKKDPRDVMFIFDFPVENTGNTPAINCTLECTREEFSDTPPPLKPIDSPFDSAGSRFDLGPKTSGGGGSRIMMSVRDAERIYEKKTNFIFVIRCSYEDFADRGKIRRTRIGGIFRVIADPLHAIRQNPVSPVINLESYSQYNYYD